jgi:hypothetical protein
VDLAEMQRRGLWEGLVSDLTFKSWNMVTRLSDDSYTLRISIGDDTQETEMPGLELDFEKRMLSFDWKGMLTRFYDPEAHYCYLVARNFYTYPGMDTDLLFRKVNELDNADYRHIAWTRQLFKDIKRQGAVVDTEARTVHTPSTHGAGRTNNVAWLGGGSGTPPIYVFT